MYTKIDESHSEISCCVCNRACMVISKLPHVTVFEGPADLVAEPEGHVRYITKRLPLNVTIVLRPYIVVPDRRRTGPLLVVEGQEILTHDHPGVCSDECRAKLGPEWEPCTPISLR